MKDTALLVRPRINEDTYRFYHSFYPDIKKVFSEWEGEATTENSLSAVASKDVKELIVVIHGLTMVHSEYVICLRGDEWYSNLSIASDILKNNPEKLYFVPVILKRWEVWPFHMGDHVLAGRTEEIKMMFERCLVKMLAGEMIYSNIHSPPLPCMLAKQYLEAKCQSPPTKEDFKKMFGIIPLEPLKYYKVSAGHKVWYSNFQPSISCLEEI